MAEGISKRGAAATSLPCASYSKGRDGGSLRLSATLSSSQEEKKGGTPNQSSSFLSRSSKHWFLQGGGRGRERKRDFSLIPFPSLSLSPTAARVSPTLLTEAAAGSSQDTLAATTAAAAATAASELRTE